MPLTKWNYRFNSFYDLSLPKFTQEMVDVLVESSNRAYRSSLAKMLPLLSKSTDEKYFAAIKDMADTARKSTAVFFYSLLIRVISVLTLRSYCKQEGTPYREERSSCADA